jgi:hypothetical protein
MYYTLLTSNATNGGTNVIGSLVAKLKMPQKIADTWTRKLFN